MAKGKCNDPVKEAERARKISETRKRKMQEAGYLNSPETRLKMAVAKQGCVVPEATRLKMSLAKKGIRPKNFDMALALAHATPKKSGPDNPSWKGEAVGYGGLHAWIRRMLGTPQYCAHCDGNKAKRFEWANVSGQYRRDITDWIRLCVPCHRKQERTLPSLRLSKRKIKET